MEPRCSTEIFFPLCYLGIHRPMCQAQTGTGGDPTYLEVPVLDPSTCLGKAEFLASILSPLPLARHASREGEHLHTGNVYISYCTGKIFTSSVLVLGILTFMLVTEFANMIAPSYNTATPKYASVVFLSTSRCVSTAR
ncbi:unnamed protein product [Ostreobium quekettii]|uniref:Uncharacterized protein n=1 Tax=Ostreobium quekettii TaxID=121088 RepID=A0A8S1J5C7_9CHLO|nr:unnamed protein product [Ostreobium quekettii]